MSFAKAIVVALSFVGHASAYKVATYSGAQGWVEDHNYYRCMHGANPLVWDNDLATKAQAWVEHLYTLNGNLEHSQCYYTWPFSGENLAKGPTGLGSFTCNGKTGQKYGQACALHSWYKEYAAGWNCNGDWNSASFSAIGHATTMLWKGIGTVGCASKGEFYACEYGHELCKTKNTVMGGQQCVGVTPQHLPNFSSCKGKACVDCYKPELAATCAAKTSSWNGSSSSAAFLLGVVATTAAPASSTSSCTADGIKRADTTCGATSYCKLVGKKGVCQGSNKACSC